LLLESSRALFTYESLKERRPVPKKLEVYGLLSGLPFEDSFSNKLVHVQEEIGKILGESLHYWVLQENLGLEYCVFKWPKGDWNKKWEQEISEKIHGIGNSFQYEVLGIQINPDGCVIAKGFDKNKELFILREKARQEFSFLPERQSGWAHIPLGRILEPLGKEKFNELSKLCNKLENSFIASCEVNKIKFIHETKWYMEDRKVLKEVDLKNEKIILEKG
jgi:hypothetical protein